MKLTKLFGIALTILVLAAPVCVWAQATSSSGYVTGTVTDPGGAVVPNANVELEQTVTHTKLTTTTNSAGIYVFSGIPPGPYKLTVTAQGFRAYTVSQFSVNVNRSYNFDAKLEVGAMTETVEVVATARAELHTHDATVGNVYGGTSMLRMPTRNRSVASLLQLQPLVMPGRGVDTDSGGQVAGARSDQTVFLLDGGDVTNSTEGSGGYITGFAAGEAGPALPVPQESIEEFRVGTTNPNATFGRAQGAQATMITKSGSNEFHGSAYWYHQNDNLDSTLWNFNRSGIPKPEKKDNRYGFSAGGPVWKDWTHIYGNFEGRRFPRSAQILRMVPTATLRNGVIIARNGVPCAAATAPFGCINLNPDPLEAPPATFGAFNPSVCGAAGTSACDPLGLGMSPTTEAWMSLYPLPNDFTSGDTRNNARFLASSDNSITDDFVVVKLDQKVTDKWNTFFSYRLNRNVVPGTLAGAVPQVDIAGLTCSTPPCSTRATTSQPRYFIIGINGQITPTLTSETRLWWTRTWWDWRTTTPAELNALANSALGLSNAAALDIGGESVSTGGNSIADPINIDTQNGRSRSWDGDDYAVAENLTWVRGKHTLQFGGDFRQQHIIHVRTDRVLGGLTTGPIFYIQDGSFLAPLGAVRPPGLPSAEQTRYGIHYTTVLGILDRSAQVQTNDGSLNPFPLGTPLVADVDIYAFSGFLQDIWRITPTLTFTFGMNYQVQRPPVEKDGKAVVPIYTASRQPVDLDIYFANRREAALRGEIYTPELGYMPINDLSGFKYVTKIDWNNWAPRVALAWNPAFDNFLFGNRKTVLRAGWAVTYTRMNGVGLVMTPILGVGPAIILACGGPTMAGTCTNTTNGTTASTAFRIGPAAGGWGGDGANIVPGSAGVPPVPLSSPIVPFGETFNFAIDPGLKLGKAHSFDLTWQREMPGNMVLEIGYVGRLGKNLIQNVDVNDIPFFFTDPASGQTGLEAFENIACEVRASDGSETALCPGGTAATLSPGDDFSLIPIQDFFENQIGLHLIALGGTGDCTVDLTLSDGVTPPTSCTHYIADFDPGAFLLGDYGNVMLYDMLFDVPYGDLGAQLNNWTSDGGKSYFHSAFVTLRKRMSYGLQFDLNYTHGRSIDYFGINQENTGFSYQSVHNYKLDQGLSVFDRTHVLNAAFFYELPFGRGKTWASENAVMDKIVGGWHISGIYQASSGLPLCVFGTTNAGAANNDGGGCARPLALPIATGGNTPHGPGANFTGSAGEMNLFADADAVRDSFRRCVYTGVDGRCGNEGLRGLPHWNLDFSLGKRTSVTERIAIAFTMDFLNIFNHMELNDPSTNFDSASFGVLGTQFGGLTEGPRRIQFGLRIEF
ncbi:MAG: carboxypeptidase regulatory-like domain-containing protein [Candidatus Acidiferrales bacterium]